MLITLDRFITNNTGKGKEIDYRVDQHVIVSYTWKKVNRHSTCSEGKRSVMMIGYLRPAERELHSTLSESRFHTLAVTVM